MADSKQYLHVTDSRTGQSYDVPIVHNAIDASAFKQMKGDAEISPRGDKVANGIRVYDPRLLNTAISTNDMTWPDADRGFLMFRGYSLDDLYRADFEDMVSLMVWKEMPSSFQRESIRYQIASAMCKVPPTVVQVIESFPASSPPTPMVIAGLSAWQASEPGFIPSYAAQNIFNGNASRTDDSIIRTIAAYGVVLAKVIAHRAGRKFTAACSDRTFYENFFRMCGNVDAKTGKPDELKVSCFRRWGPVIVDHGMTNSTFALRVTASSLPDPIAPLVSALSAASGLLHFGAQEAAYRTMESIGTPDNVPGLMDKVKRKEFRLFGYGHASYKTIDPRVAPVVKLLEELGTESIPLMRVAEAIHKASENDEYFVKRQLFPNVDHYSQFFYPALGFSCEYSPVISFLQRLPGFMAHWKEMMGSKVALIRPTDIYTGPTEPQHYIPN